MKILIVDDKDDARYLLRALLTGHGHIVEEAANGEEALDKLRGDQFDLAISDILMPVMDGFRLCQEVRKDNQLKSIPFIFYSATYVQNGDVEFGMKLGADDFIIKPAEPDALLDRIQNVIAKTRTTGRKTRRPELTGEADILRLYSRRLVTKLEERTARLDRELAERSKVEEALRKREEDYRLVVESASEAIFIAQDGNIKFPNPATMRLLGRTADEIASRPFVQFIHPEDQGLVAERHKRRLAGEEVEVGYEFRFVATDGSVRWGRLNATRVEWEGRAATLNLVSDVTERRQAEHERFEALSRFSGFADASQYGMGMANLDGRIVYVNPTLTRMLGEKAPDDCLGKRFPTYYTEEASRRIREEVMPALMEKGYWHGELELRTADGRKIPTDENYFIIRDENDQPHYIADILTDITDRKHAEEKLRTSEAQLSNALRIAHAGHWEYDVETDTFTFNDNFYRIFRTTAEEVGGYSMSSVEYARRFCHPDDVHMVREETQAAIETDDPYYGRELEHRILYADGSVGHIAVRLFIVKDSRGRTVRTYGVNQDITERLEAQERIQSALEGTIQVVAETIERRDPYTSGHQKRVTRLAVAIARRMSLPSDQIEGIRVAATLHDIGKMSTPAEILSKPGKLTEHEFRLIQEHPKVAHEILKAIAFPWPVADIILQHHERLDGTGYPLALTAEDGILLEARILAVSDVVEAMATHRPYRPALGIEAALEEIRSNSGTKFDSTVVETCVDLFASGEFTLDE